jgi:hypothetical protein
MKNPSQPGEDYPVGRGRATHQENTANLFNYINLGHIDLVTNFVSQNPVSPNMPNEQGETPLIAAIHADKPEIVLMLLRSKAAVDRYGLCSEEGQNTQVQRTPLQVAATEGKLEIVKILRENRADVSCVAPDGATAFQLATKNNHQEVINCLKIGYNTALDGSHQPPIKNPPARRDVQNATNDEQTQPLRRILRSFGSILKYIAWIIPKFLFYTLPTYVIFTIPKHILTTIPTEIWACCQRQIHKLPNPVKRAADLADRGIKKAAKVIIKTPAKTWQIMKRIPSAVWTIMLCIGVRLGKLGKAGLHIVKRMVSFVQTIISTVASFFRATTLHDITDGFRAILRAILIDVPKAISWFAVAFGKTSGVVLQTILGALGKIVVFFAALMLGLLLWFPRKIWGLLQACGTSVGKGVEEILMLLNPKRM